MATRYQKYVDDDMIITAMLFSGMAPDEVARRMEQAGGDARRALDSLKDPTSSSQTRDKFGLIKDWLDHVGTGNVEKMLTKGAGLNEDDVKSAIYWAQREVGGTATPTLDRVLYFLGGAEGRAKQGSSHAFAATVRPGLQTVGRGDTALMTTRTQYKTGAKPAAAPPGPPPPPGPAPAPGGFQPSTAGAGDYVYRGEAKPATPTKTTRPLRQDTIPAGGTLGGTLGGTTTQSQQTPGLRNLPRLSPNAPPEEVDAYIRKHYGYHAWILDIPELRGKMIELGRQFAGAPEISELAVEGALSGTEWWKTHSGPQRLAIEEKATDPAQYNAKLEGKYREMALLAGQVGFTVPEARLREMARNAYDMGWNTAEIRSALSAEFDYNPETGQEDQTKIVADLRQLASDYLVPLGEQTVDQWGRQIIAGTSTNEDFAAYAKSMAKGMFAHWAPDIDAGRTVKQIADPFKQMAMKDLELTEDQIDFMDPKWRKALELDPETGQPMQPSKWQRLIRQDSSYGWDRTQNARGEAAEFAKQIATAFGR